MMYYKPCRHCRVRNNCRYKTILSEQIKKINKLTKPAIKMSSVNFTCGKRSIGIIPGARVSLELWIYSLTSINTTHDEPGYDTWEKDWKEERVGTVMRYIKGKALIWLDGSIPRAFKDDEMSIRVKVWPDRLTPLWESVAVCSECGKPEDKDNDEKWHCDECSPHVDDRIQ